MSQSNTLTATLGESWNDPWAVARVLAREADGGARLLALAYTNFRMALWRGEVHAARAIGQAIHAAEKARGAEAESAGVFDSAAAIWLLNAIQTAKAGDCWSAHEQLQSIGDAPHLGETLHWSASVWRARTLMMIGDLEAAEETLMQARQVAEQLDAQTQHATQCVLGEVEALSGELTLALERADDAIEAFAALDDLRGQAGAYFSRARILYGARLDAESARAAEHAHETDPDWPAPVLLLARSAIETGRTDDADRLLRSLSPRPPEAETELRLLARISAGEVPLWAVIEYYALHDAPASEAAVGQLKALVTFQPAFIEARRTLGWKLLHLENFAEAETHFKALDEIPELDTDTRLSTSLGLECATILRLHNETAAEPPPFDPDDDLTPAFATPPVLTSEHPPSRDALEGDLELLALPELLEFLRGTQRTGVLAISSALGTGSLCLHRGMLVAASSPRYPGRCAQLDKSGDGAAPEPRASTSVASEGAARQQIYDAVSDLVSWNAGRFAFQPDGRCEVNPPGFAVQLDPQGVLLSVLADE